MNLDYEFKIAQELAWAFVVGAGTVLLTILVKFDPETVTDWKTWAIASGSAALRAGFAAATPVFLKHGKSFLSRVSN